MIWLNSIDLPLLDFNPFARFWNSKDLMAFVSIDWADFGPQAIHIIFNINTLKKFFNS